MPCAAAPSPRLCVIAGRAAGVPTYGENACTLPRRAIVWPRETPIGSRFTPARSAESWGMSARPQKSPSPKCAHPAFAAS
jgi:hypothetical protein